jgi:hypothetical protein
MQSPKLQMEEYNWKQQGEHKRKEVEVLRIKAEQLKMYEKVEQKKYKKKYV